MFKVEQYVRVKANGCVGVVDEVDERAQVYKVVFDTGEVGAYKESDLEFADRRLRFIWSEEFGLARIRVYNINCERVIEGVYTEDRNKAHNAVERGLHEVTLFAKVDL